MKIVSTAKEATGNSWGFSLKNTLTLVAGVVMVSVVTVRRMYFPCRFWVKSGRRQRIGRDMEAVAGADGEAAGNLKEIEYAAAGNLKEIEYFGNAEAEGGNVNRAVILSFPTYGKQEF